MNNLEFLQYINAIIYQNQDKYYVYIPSIKVYEDNNYIDNFDNGIYVKLTNELLENSDLEDLILMDYIESENYEIIHKKDIYTLPNTNMERIDNNSYKYFAKINNLLDKEIEEENILNFYQSFMIIIEDYSEVQNIEYIKTQIYKKVIEYYSNGQTDCVLQGMNLILNSTSYDYLDSSKYTTCGCNNAVDDLTSNSTTLTGLSTTLDCVTAYKKSMYLYLVQMLSDIDFYNNFMFVEDEPNEDLIDNLISLIEALEDMEFSLDFSQTNNHCLCSELETKNTNNYSILNNYKKVLNWIKNCEIEENTNKIKIYGKQFAELLPNLQF